VMELAMGYEGGVGAFITFAAVYNMDLDQLADAVWATTSQADLYQAEQIWNWTQKKRRSTYGLSQHVWIACEVLKRKWRDAHPAVVKLWKKAHAAVANAIATPGVPFAIGEHLKAQRDGAWLRIRLPSGRCLCYLHPEVSEFGDISYMGINQYTRRWDRIKTYGGKLVENVTQASSRDVLAANMPAIEDALSVLDDDPNTGIILTVHDEVLTEVPDNGTFSSDDLAALMSRVPPWAKGLPLAAKGFETDRYRKD
jgi:DNA polymerase bacteriophage-type